MCPNPDSELQSCNNCFVCVCFMSVLLCIKTHVSTRNGKPVGSPSCHSHFSSFGQTEEGQYGNSFQAQTLQIFFQIAYLLFKLYQSKFAWVLCPLESPLMPSRAISVSVQITTLAASLSLGLCRFDYITRPQCTLISSSKEAKDRGKGLQGSRDRKQDHLNDTQISKFPH